MVVIEKSGIEFLKGGGEMGELVRSKDWSTTPLGDPQTWPQSLRTIVSTLLNSQFPMFVWWGEDLITIYNDAYRVIAGNKHPKSLGQAGNIAWEEIWDVVGPLSQKVMQEGVSTWSEDQVLYINRSGFVEETYFTFSYSPVFKETGEVGGVYCACAETTDKVLAERKIRESERNLRSTILQAPVAMCILKEPDYKVEIANQRMYELWGRGEEDLLRQPIFKGLPEAANNGLEELLLHVYTSGETRSGNEMQITVPRNGKPTEVFVNFVYEPFRNGEGVIAGIIAVAIEVTEQVLARKKIEESEKELQRRVKERTIELENANIELQRSNKNLEEFAYAASHDLKEPIRKVHFFSDRLKKSLEERLTEEEKRSFERLEIASRRMSTLIDDLLSYSHITKEPILNEEADLGRKVAIVLQDLELDIEQKKAVITVENLPRIKGHKRQLQQLFQNLIGNSLKYSKPEEAPIIKITSRLVTGKETGYPVNGEDESKRFYLIEVEDNGIGFDQQHAERIFNVFTRLHGNAEYKGTGVGLSIARKVIENHKGYIWAISEPGEGATFKLLFPIED